MNKQRTYFAAKVKLAAATEQRVSALGSWAVRTLLPPLGTPKSGADVPELANGKSPALSQR